MAYPTLDEVEKADEQQLAYWYRYLASPGASAIGSTPSNFKCKVREEKIIMDRICERFRTRGGFNPKLSKIVGWDG